MKKKKLKKKIKKLERKIQWLNDCERTLALRCDKFYHNDVEIKNDICELKDSKGCKDDIKDLNARMDDLLLSTNYLINSVKRIDTRCDVLDRRTQTDYNGITTKTEEKTCDTCDYLGLSGCGTQCVECSANNKKETENGN